MCSHYDPQTDPLRLRTHFGVGDLPLGLKPSLWPGYFGPFVRKHEFADVGDEAVPERELLVGSFGLIPHWSKDATIARRTYNARSETVHEKPSFRDAWKAARHCVIPAEAIYEPDWRSGKAVPTRITRADGMPMGIAGIWGTWKSPTGEAVHSYTMLTINADDHPFMRQFHKPEDEKRMVVILDESLYGDWLSAPVSESREFLRPDFRSAAEAVGAPHFLNFFDRRRGRPIRYADVPFESRCQSRQRIKTLRKEIPMAKSNSNSGARAPMTPSAAARIQGATARSTGGTVAKGSFAARAQSAAAHNGFGKSGNGK